MSERPARILAIGVAMGLLIAAALLGWWLLEVVIGVPSREDYLVVALGALICCRRAAGKGAFGVAWAAAAAAVIALAGRVAP